MIEHTPGPIKDLIAAFVLALQNSNFLLFGNIVANKPIIVIALKEFIIEFFFLLQKDVRVHTQHRGVAETQQLHVWPKSGRAQEPREVSSSIDLREVFHQRVVVAALLARHFENF